MEESCFATFGKMSRIGNSVITLPEGVKVEKIDSALMVNGPKGKLSVNLFDGLDLKIEEGLINVSRKNDDSESKSMHGTMRQLIHNAVEGVSNGFSKHLELNGVAYWAVLQGKTLKLALGYSHDIEFEIPDSVKITVPKPTEITINGIDQQVVGQIAANIREKRKPEPYKGKGIRYKDEYVFAKEGKKK
mgnify:CR=1 FL=1